MYVCESSVCVCVCVCERDKGRERNCECSEAGNVCECVSTLFYTQTCNEIKPCVCVCVCVCVCACVCVCVCECVFLFVWWVMLITLSRCVHECVCVCVCSMCVLLASCFKDLISLLWYYSEGGDEEGDN